MAGRPKKPSHLKSIQGTARKDRANKNEPKVTPGLPPCPEKFKGLSEEKHWNYFGKTLADMRVMTVADIHALEELCMLAADRDAARERLFTPDITNGGRNYDPIEFTTGDKGQDILKAHPCVSIVSDKSAQILKYLSQFGLTPASRSNVAMAPEEEVNPFKKLLSSKKQS